MLVAATYLNATEGYIIGDDPPCEPFTDNVGKLFRYCLREFGRCVSKQYVEPDAKPIGWVFQRQERYEDTGEPYLREVWITLLDAPDTVTRTPHYHYL